MALIDRLEAFERAETWMDAERELDAVAAERRPAEVGLGDRYDELVEEAVEADEDFEAAARLQRKALEAGCTYQELGREMLGWYLLKAGHRVEAEEQFDSLRAERGADVHLELTRANALLDSGHSEDALKGFDRALELARAADEGALDEVRLERREAREELRVHADAEDRLVQRSDLGVDPQTLQAAVAWFPRSEHAEALARWPGLADDLEEPDSYCRMIELALRRASPPGSPTALAAPLRVSELEEFAAERELHADSARARSGLDAELARTGRALSWPPSRNDPCWCGSGRKYKRCCGGL